MNYLELTGALFGIAGVYLTVRENMWCFPVGIINVIITAYLLINARLYADFLQQVVYFILLIWGWYKWTEKDAQKNRHEIISYLPKAQLAFYFTLWVLGTAGLYFLLVKFTDAHFPFWDSTGTVLCFIAQWFVARKYIENWLLWMAANVMYVVIYYLKDMPFYSALTLIYLLLAIRGYKEWKQKFSEG